MNPTEALKVLRKVIAYQPNQRVDELTPEAWAEALEPHYLSDALAVVKELALAPRSEYRPPFIEIGDIVNELKSIESRRAEDRWSQVSHLRPPFEGSLDNPDDLNRHALAEQEWSKRMRREIKRPDWTPPEPPPAIEPARPPESLIRRIADIRSVNRALACPPPIVSHCPGCTCETGQP